MPDAQRDQSLKVKYATRTRVYFNGRPVRSRARKPWIPGRFLRVRGEGYADMLTGHVLI